MLILLLSCCPLNLWDILSKATCSPPSEIHEILHNPNAQFSASIFSGIQGTYVSSSCSPCNMCAWTRKCMPTHMYTCKRVRAQSSEWKRQGNERTNERGKIVDSMGLMTLARQSDCRQLFHDRNSFCRLNNLRAQSFSGTYSRQSVIRDRIAFTVCFFFYI